MIRGVVLHAIPEERLVTWECEDCSEIGPDCLTADEASAIGDKHKCLEGG